MKKLTLLMLLMLWLAGSDVHAQSNVGINTTLPDASAILDLTSTSSGLLVPRMTLIQRNAITAPATGLLIYQTNSTPLFYYWNAVAWIPILSTSSGWFVTGNAGTVAGTNFLGTTNNVSLNLRTYSTVNTTGLVTFASNGFFGIGQTAPTRPFELVNDNASSYTASFRTATSETGVLVGCANNSSTVGSLQAFRNAGGTNVAANLAFQPTSPGAVAGKVGVSMSASLPTAKLDIVGDLALRRYDTTAVDTVGAGSNNNYDVRGNTFIRITGPTHQFKITGVAGGQNGRIVTLFNATPTLSTHSGQHMVIANSSASSSAANRILTLSGADIVCSANASVSMIYSTAENNWIVFAVSK